MTTDSARVIAHNVLGLEFGSIVTGRSEYIDMLVAAGIAERVEEVF